MSVTTVDAALPKDTSSQSQLVVAAEKRSFGAISVLVSRCTGFDRGSAPGIIDE